MADPSFSGGLDWDRL